LQMFQSFFEHLQLLSKGEEQYLGLPDGRGYITLTPFLFEANAETAFLGYYIYQSGSDGESRGEPTPDRLFLGEIAAVPLSPDDIPGELFTGH
jgi:hypothetical protein